MTFFYNSEFKRREKVRAKEAAKAAKAATAPPKEAKAKNEEDGEEELNPNVSSLCLDRISE
jgi:lysyl-tRNA synthetase class 2